MPALLNAAPETHWYRCALACGVIRHRLCIGGSETPYFIDDARKAGIGHWTAGAPIGLFGAGMGRELRRRDGKSYRMAATLGGFRNVGLAKARAEMWALAD